MGLSVVVGAFVLEVGRGVVVDGVVVDGVVVFGDVVGGGVGLLVVDGGVGLVVVGVVVGLVVEGGVVGLLVEGGRVVVVVIFGLLGRGKLILSPEKNLSELKLALFRLVKYRVFPQFGAPIHCLLVKNYVRSS